MKKIQFIAPLFAMFALFTACEDDRDMTIYDGSLATPAQLTDIDNAYVLNADKETEAAISFEWSAADMGYQAVVKYNIEMGKANDNFQTKVSVATVEKETKHSITVAQANAAIIKLLGDDFNTDPHAIEFRIAATISDAVAPVYSNAVTTTITPYSSEKEYPQIWIVGDYCGWNHDNSQFLYSAEEDDNYEGMIYFDGKSANGWKLCPAANWDAEWAGNGKPAAEAPTLTLVTSGGDNLTNYAHNSYYLKFNKATATLSVSQGYDSWGVCGEHNNWGSTADPAMTLASETKFGKLQHYLTVTLDLQAEKGWKIRPDNKWENDKGANQLKYEGVQSDNGNFFVAEDGNYTIKWYFNKVEPKIEVIKN